jgi:hypothetical protein
MDPLVQLYFCHRHDLFGIDRCGSLAIGLGDDEFVAVGQLCATGRRCLGGISRSFGDGIPVVEFVGISRAMVVWHGGRLRGQS